MGRGTRPRPSRPWTGRSSWSDIVPIPGTKRRRYLEENAAAASIRLSAGELAKIDEGLPPGVASGTRYPEAMMKLVERP